MALRLASSDPDFEERFAALIATKREVSVEADEAVRAIIERVRAAGDAPLRDYSKRFDNAALDAVGLAVTAAEIEAAHGQADKATVEALIFARDRIAAHHERQRPK